MEAELRRDDGLDEFRLAAELAATGRPLQQTKWMLAFLQVYYAPGPE